MVDKTKWRVRNKLIRTCLTMPQNKLLLLDAELKKLEALRRGKK